MMTLLAPEAGVGAAGSAVAGSSGKREVVLVTGGTCWGMGLSAGQLAPTTASMKGSRALLVLTAALMMAVARRAAARGRR